MNTTYKYNLKKIYIYIYISYYKLYSIFSTTSIIIYNFFFIHS